MKNMRNLCKLMVLVLTLTTVLSGCTSQVNIQESGDAPAPSANNQAQASVDTKEEAAVSENADTQAQEQEEEKYAVIVPISCNEEYYDKFSDEERQLVHGVYDSLMVSADGFDALNRTLESMNEERREAVIRDVDEYYEMALVDLESDEFPDEWFPYSSEYHTDVIRSDERIVSILQTFYGFAGGAHPNTYYGAANFDTATGKKLSIKDIVSDTEEFARVLEEETLKVVDKDMLIVEDISGVIKELMDESVSENELNFIMDYEGLEVIFSPYELTAYAAGAQRVRLNYADYPELIDQSYAVAPQNYMDRVYEGISYYTGRPGDEDRKEISFDEKISDPEGIISVCSVRLNDTEGEPDTEGYYYRSVKYIAHMGDKTYALMCKLTDNDYWYTTVYDLNSEVAVKKENLDASIDRDYFPADPEALRLIIRCNVLSTYDVLQIHKMNEDGSVTPKEPFGYAIHEYFPPLRLKKAVDVHMLDDEEGKNSHDVTLGSQTEVEIYRTDLEKQVDFKLNDGNIVRFDDERGGEGMYSQMIDGTPIEEVFEEVYFAG